MRSTKLACYTDSVRLASLTLQGFKSFADRTTVEFTPGVTAVVGPNGSGKSNLIDALRWVSGGGRASEFRAGDKTELIFHGASGKRSLGYAEVVLELEHEGHTLAVSRTLFRDGGGQLRLGGRAARFLDLEEELSGSGLGRGGLAVIGQGEVSGVLMADPPKLLSYVAEAAGVAKLASRREGTLARLAAAREHLERLEDLKAELARRLEALAEEAAQAARAATLARERLRLRFSLSWRRVEGLERELEGLRARSGELQGELLDGRETLSAAQETRRAAKAHLAEAEAHYRRFVADLEARRGDVRVAEERLLAAEARHAALLRERARVAEEREALAALPPPTPPEGDEARLVRSLEAAEAEGEALGAQVEGLGAEVAEGARALEAARRAEADAKEAGAAYRSRKENLRAQLAEVDARLEALESRLGTDHEDAVTEVKEAFEARRVALAALQEELAGLQGAHAAASAEAQARTRAVTRARAALEARRGYAQGPKSALTSGIRGVIGSVADLVRVPPEYAVALSSALGRRAENVVVSSAEVAREVLAHVRRTGGWVTLLPLDLVQGRPATLPSTLQGEGSVIGLCSDLIRTEARFEGVIQQLLGGTVLVTTAEAAVAFARRLPRRPRLVTVGGDVIEAYGAISGGRPQTGGMVLGAAAEFAEAAAAAEAATREAEGLTEALWAVQARTRETQAELESSRRALEAAAAALAREREARAARASLEAELTGRRAGLTEALASLQAPEVAPFPDPAPLARVLDERRSALEAVRERVGARRQALEAAKGALALLRERSASFEEASTRYRAGRVKLGELEARLEALGLEEGGARAALSSAREHLSAAREAVPEDLETQEAAYRRARAEESKAESTLEALSQQQAARSAELEALNLSLARREAALEGAQEELKGFPVGLEVQGGGTKALRDRLAEVEAESEALGPVNHRAAHEEEAQRARLDELSAQTEEAGGAADELNAVLADIDDAVRVRLVAAIGGLERGFVRHVEELFGAGAHASVEVLWEEGRPSGLKLGLQPPGKQTRSLSLLSVGERTMGAMAFLFALTRATDRGTEGLPLAILDEVDAPLDEANIRRFCIFLTQLAVEGTQFVLITHQKATMEVADALWGVTTERGVSRVFSIRRETAPQSVG